MDKIIYGDVVGLPNPRPDWNQTDSTKADYIKNKPDNLATTELVEQSIASIEQNIAEVAQDVVEINESIAGVNQDITGIKQDIADSDQEIIDIKQGITNVNKDIDNLEQNITDIDQEIIDIKQDIMGADQEIANVKQDMVDTNQNIDDIAQNLAEVGQSIVDINTNITDIKSNIAKVENSILNKEVGISFETMREMVSDLLSMDKVELKVPFGLYIIEATVPDFWVCEVLDDRFGYVYPGDEEFINQLRQAPVQIGHYKISILETAKVDLSDYVPITRTIAGVSLDHDVTAEEVRDNIGIEDIIDSKLQITIYEEDEMV